MKEKANENTKEVINGVRDLMLVPTGPFDSLEFNKRKQQKKKTKKQNKTKTKEKKNKLKMNYLNN